MVAPRHPVPGSLRTSALLIGIGIVLFVCYTTLDLNSRSLITIAATKLVVTMAGTTTTTTTATSFSTTEAAAVAVAAQQNQNQNQFIDVSSALFVSARQTGTSPPRITFSVTNNSTQPLTVLTWDTPLDPLALQLGHVIVSVSSGAAGEQARPLEIPSIMIRRKMPPGVEALVTIAPAETAENEVVLREAIVPAEKLPQPGGDGGGVEAFVVCKGRWATVWPAASAKEVTEEERRQLGAGKRVLTGSYESEPLEIKVEGGGEDEKEPAELS